MKTQQILKTLSFTVGALCLFGSSVNAANLSQRGPISFDVYDTDRDNIVSKKEFYDAREKRNTANAPEFSQFDKNKDGKISKYELSEGQKAQRHNKRSNRR